MVLPEIIVPVLVFIRRKYSPGIKRIAKISIRLATFVLMIKLYLTLLSNNYKTTEDKICILKWKYFTPSVTSR